MQGKRWVVISPKRGALTMMGISRLNNGLECGFWGDVNATMRCSE